MYARYDYYDEMAYENMLDDKIVKEMHELKCCALEKLKSTVHPALADSFGSILASVNIEYENDPDVMKIANACDLSKLDLLSLSNDFDMFKEEYLKDLSYMDA